MSIEEPRVNNIRVLDTQQIQNILTSLKVSKGLRRRLSFAVVRETPTSAWGDYEVFGLSTKDGAAGILLIELQGELYATTYEIGYVGDKLTGRAKPVICDFCKTWQAGGRAGSITFYTERRSLNSISFLCCLDLNCSLHVRDMTEAAKSSRAQLREDVSPERRIERLKDKLALLTERLSLEPIINSVEEEENK